MSLAIIDLHSLNFSAQRTYGRGVCYKALYAYLIRHGVDRVIVVNIGDLPSEMRVSDPLLKIELDVLPKWKDATKRTALGRVSYHIGKHEGEEIHVLTSNPQIYYTGQHFEVLGYGLRQSLRARTDIPTIELPTLTLDWS